MVIKNGTICIIADDLTGANDTALQFHLRGSNTQILFDYITVPVGGINTHTWAISTETRNIDADKAAEIVSNAAKMMVENLGVEYMYKKMDSTLRGNIAAESLAVLDALNWDAAVIVPAFPAEGRITVGGYQLLKGTPLERTEVARDPQFPIYESHIPSLLKKQVENPDLVAHIELKTVMRGAGPILVELQELIKSKKKLIVIDAVSITDIEQIVLATEKSNFNILPCGSAGLAQSYANLLLPEMKHQHITKTLPALPIFMVVGSVTSTSRAQVNKLAESDEFEPHIIQLGPEHILGEPSEEIINRVVEHLKDNEIVLVHSALPEDGLAQTLEYADQHGMPTENVPAIVSNYLAKLTEKVVERRNVILVLVGGETSYKCCNALGSKQLQLIDEVEPAIPLCLDHKAQWIVTKSGNLGTPNTLINILKYFQRHQETA